MSYGRIFAYILKYFLRILGKVFDNAKEEVRPPNPFCTLFSSSEWTAIQRG